MLVSTSVMIRFDESPPLIRNTIIKQNASRKVKSKEIKYALDDGEMVSNELTDRSVNSMRNTKGKKKEKNTEWDKDKSKIFPGEYGNRGGSCKITEGFSIYFEKKKKDWK